MFILGFVTDTCAKVPEIPVVDNHNPPCVGPGGDLLLEYMHHYKEKHLLTII